VAAVQAATAHRVHQRNKTQYAQLGLDDRTLRAAGDVVTSAVADGPRTRAQVGERLSVAGIDVSGLALGVLMMWAELECSGPLDGKQHTYAAWDSAPTPPRDEAVVRLAERFFSSHGPATIDDFAAWSSLTRTQARAAVAELPVRRAEVSGVECLWLGALSADAWDSPQLELLNPYDEYISGLVASEKRWLDRAGLWRERPAAPLALVMADGQLAGHWRRATGSSRVDLDVLALRPFTRKESAALERNVRIYGEFLGTPTTVTVRLAE
jgi:hypothetical protein